MTVLRPAAANAGEEAVRTSPERVIRSCGVPNLTWCIDSNLADKALLFDSATLMTVSGVAHPNPRQAVFDAMLDGSGDPSAGAKPEQEGDQAEVDEPGPEPGRLLDPAPTAAVHRSG
ncbi:hypothetical protein [Dactylosporangium sp. NPDC051484]|uniref:hypothetical protein n=1 Tax=Dactylosporangium sp. NPDC051484 TaxID=3154942 RepID=UPI00344F3F28